MFAGPHETAPLTESLILGWCAVLNLMGSTRARAAT